jgi:glutamate-1-semialdehyde 2,1-aminomutase
VTAIEPVDHSVDVGRYDQSIELHQSAAAVLPGGVNSHFRLGGYPVPLFFSRGEGAHLWDVDGNRYVDFVLGMGPNILGHAPRPVIDAVSRSLVDGQLFAGQHVGEVELAERLKLLIPSAEAGRLGLSGSEMAHAAVRLARAATGRPRVLKFEGHYHGWLDSILFSVQSASLDGPSSQLGRWEPRPESAGQPATAGADVDVIGWNDIAAIREYLDERASSLAAVIMEPIQCNTGVILPADGYLEEVRELCDRVGAVLIFDEVITGFRVGRSGAQGMLGVTPDLTILAKALGGGFPVAALVGRRRYMELLGNGSVVHGGTYNANRISVAAASATLDVLSEEDGACYVRMQALGERLMDGLREAAAALEVNLVVQGLGAVFNTTFSDRPIRNVRDYYGSDRGRQGRFLQALQDRGIRVTSRGTWFLSTAHTSTDIDDALAAAREALTVSAN